MNVKDLTTLELATTIAGAMNRVFQRINEGMGSPPDVDVPEIMVDELLDVKSRDELEAMYKEAVKVEETMERFRGSKGISLSEPFKNIPLPPSTDLIDENDDPTKVYSVRDIRAHYPSFSTDEMN
jgi:hypothetical protein